MIYERARPKVADPRRAVGLLFLGLTAAVLVGKAVLGVLPVAFLGLMKALPATFAAHEAAGFALCLLTMLPATVLFGVSFPLLTHLLSVEERGAQQASGALYAWNTAGAIAGAVLADLVLVGSLGLERSYLLLAALPPPPRPLRVRAAPSSPP